MNPLELIDYLVAGTTLLIGVAIGRKMRSKPPEPLRPICSCEHGYGQHDAEEGCQADVRQELPGLNWQWVDCPCWHYDGPDPALFGLEKL